MERTPLSLSARGVGANGESGGARRALRLGLVGLACALVSLVACKSSTSHTPAPKLTTSAAGGVGGAGVGGAGGSGGAGAGGAGGHTGGAGGLHQVCGDGRRYGTEECDGKDLGVNTCQTLGFDAGKLACKKDCTYDRAGCSGTETCWDGRNNDGDGKIDCKDVKDCGAACAAACAKVPVLANPTAGLTALTDGHAGGEPISCVTGAGGPELVFEVDAAVTGMLDVSTLNDQAHPGDLAVAVRTTCAAAGAMELGCAHSVDNGGSPGAFEYLSVPVTANTRYFIVVQGNTATDVGAFTLDVTNRAIKCGDGHLDPGEECDNGPNLGSAGCSKTCTFLPTEVEPNNTPATANAASAGKVFFAQMNYVGDIDYIAITLAADGGVTVETDDVGEGGCSLHLIDTVLDLYDTDGTTLLVHDLHSGDGTCSRATIGGLKAGKTYYAAIQANPSSQHTKFVYSIDINPSVCGNQVVELGEECDGQPGCGPNCKWALTEMEPNDTPAQANAYPGKGKWHAQILPLTDVDVVKFDVAGPDLWVYVNLTDDGTGRCVKNQLNAHVDLLGTDGVTMLGSADSGPNDSCAFIRFKVPGPGTYFAAVSQNVLSQKPFEYGLDVEILSN